MFKKILKKTQKENTELLDLISSKEFSEKKANDLLSKGSKIDWISDSGENYFHIAARKANMEALSWLKGKNLNINQITSSNLSPLFYAVESNSLPAVKFLLENGADINHKNSFDRTVLQEAVISGKNSLVLPLIQCGVKINNIDSKGRNVVFDSVANGTKGLVEKIASLKGIDINHIDTKGLSVMHEKSVFDNPDLALILMENGADPTICDSEGRNFLFYSACGGIENEPLIDRAIELGCDINTKNHENESILMETLKAYRSSSDAEQKLSILKMAQKLIDIGVDIDAKNISGENVIIQAIKNNDLTILEFIASQKHRDLNVPDADGNTPLVLAALLGGDNYDLLLTLLKYNVDSNIPDNNGITITEKLIDIILHVNNGKDLEHTKSDVIFEKREYLYVLKEILSNTKTNLHILNSRSVPLFFDVILYNNKKLLSLLKENGININQVAEDGESIVFRFIDEIMKINDPEKKKEMIEYLENLINSGVDINLQNKEGKTAVHQSIIKGCDSLARIFLEAKVNPNICDNRGRTLAHCCVWEEKIEHFKMLTQRFRTILNKADLYGILPIHYAAFLGHVKLTLKMIEIGSFVNSGKDIAPKMLEHLKKFADNLDKLEEQTKDENEKANLKILVNKMKKEFKI